MLLFLALWIATRKQQPDSLPEGSHGGAVREYQATDAPGFRSKTVSSKSARAPLATRSAMESRLEERVRLAKEFHKSATLFAMDSEGIYPSEDAWNELRESGRDLPEIMATPGSSDWYLQQLIAVGILKDEETFYLPRPGEKTSKLELNGIIEPGECGFSYLKNRANTDNSRLPLLLAPMIPGTLSFDREAFGGKAIIVYLGGDVKTFDISLDGSLAGKGADLFEHGEGTVWRDKPVSPSQFAYPAEP